MSRVISIVFLTEAQSSQIFMISLSNRNESPPRFSLQFLVASKITDHEVVFDVAINLG